MTKQQPQSDLTQEIADDIIYLWDNPLEITRIVKKHKAACQRSKSVRSMLSAAGCFSGKLTSYEATHLVERATFDWMKL